MQCVDTCHVFVYSDCQNMIFVNRSSTSACVVVCVRGQQRFQQCIGHWIGYRCNVQVQVLSCELCYEFNIKNMLLSWTQNSNSKRCTMANRFVQFMKNTSHHAGSNPTFMNVGHWSKSWTGIHCTAKRCNSTDGNRRRPYVSPQLQCTDSDAVLQSRSDEQVINRGRPHTWSFE